MSLKNINDAIKSMPIKKVHDKAKVHDGLQNQACNAQVYKAITAPTAAPATARNIPSRTPVVAAAFGVALAELDGVVPLAVLLPRLVVPVGGAEPDSLTGADGTPETAVEVEIAVVFPPGPLSLAVGVTVMKVVVLRVMVISVSVAEVDPGVVVLNGNQSEYGAQGYVRFGSLWSSTSRNGGLRWSRH